MIGRVVKGLTVEDKVLNLLIKLALMNLIIIYETKVRNKKL